VQRELLADRIPISDATARLDRGDVDARDVDVLLDRHVGGRDRRVGGGSVTRFPMPDVVVLLVRSTVRTEDERAVLERLVRVGDDRQRLVVDEDGSDSVGGGIARGGDDRGDLLRLVHDGVHREHHLHVAGQRRHPVELVAFQVLAGDNGGDTRDLQRLGSVDRLDRRVGVGTPDDVEPELPRQVDVLDVLALAADEARVLLALDGMAHAPDFGAGAELGFGGHRRLPQPAAAGSAETS
jgi:hypothetical protein